MQSWDHFRVRSRVRVVSLSLPGCVRNPSWAHKASTGPPGHLQWILMATSCRVPTSFWVVENKLPIFHLKGSRKETGTIASHVYMSNSVLNNHSQLFSDNAFLIVLYSICLSVSACVTQVCVPVPVHANACMCVHVEAKHWYLVSSSLPLYLTFENGLSRKLAGCLSLPLSAGVTEVEVTPCPGFLWCAGNWSLRSPWQALCWRSHLLNLFFWF